MHATLGCSPQTVLKEQYSALEESRADLVALYFLPDPKMVEMGLIRAEDHDDGRARRVRELRAHGARAVAAHPRGHDDRGRPHAQPPDDRPLADGEYEGHREARARREDVSRDGGREGLSRGCRDGSSPRCSASRPTGTIRLPRRCSRQHGIHFDPALRDEMVARVDKLKLPSYTGSSSRSWSRCAMPTGPSAT